MTKRIPGPGREHLTRLMRSRGHDGVLRMRTSGDAALNLPRPEGTTMATPAPVPTRMEIQITGIRKHFAECVTEQDGGEMCDACSSDWDSPCRRTHGFAPTQTRRDTQSSRSTRKRTSPPLRSLRRRSEGQAARCD